MIIIVWIIAKESLLWYRVEVYNMFVNKKTYFCIVVAIIQEGFYHKVSEKLLFLGIPILVHWIVKDWHSRLD